MGQSSRKCPKRSQATHITHPPFFDKAMYQFDRLIYCCTLLIDVVYNITITIICQLPHSVTKGRKEHWNGHSSTHVWLLLEAGGWIAGWADTPRMHLPKSNIKLRVAARQPFRTQEIYKRWDFSDMKFITHQTYQSDKDSQASDELADVTFSDQRIYLQMKRSIFLFTAKPPYSTLLNFISNALVMYLILG